jgi:hypothetical protein
MNTPLILTTTSDRSRCRQLERSLILHGYGYHIIEHKWDGFLGKIHETYKYLKTCATHTHFLYTDAWDTVALRPDVQVPDGILISAERACYPHPEKAKLYPPHDSPWKYVNGGGWCGEISEFIRMYESKPPTDELNDQVWLTDRFLAGWGKLDYECEVFQTLAFNGKHDLGTLGGQFTNHLRGTFPAFIHGNGHTPMTEIYKLLPDTMNTLNEACSLWQDNVETHAKIHHHFCDMVNATPSLKEYRDWIEANIFGFGERSFLWMWKLILDTLPPDASLLEIGVFRGQILGLWRMLAPEATITGITPLDSTDGHWTSDYAADIKLLHETFGLEQPEIIKGLSTDPAIQEIASRQQYDVIYVDGGHDFSTAYGDVYTYSSFVKVGGYLVVDDCAHKYNLPDGMFKGIESVSKAVDQLLPNDYYKEIFSVAHNRVFRRIK